MSNPDVSSKALTISSNIMVAAIVFFFAVVVFVFLLHLYAKWRWGSRHPTRSTRSRLVFTPVHHHAGDPGRGLDPSVIQSLPVHEYTSEDAKEAKECSVCLSELAIGEKVRFLPKCNHGFHLECIDMWFFSHATCPLCRNAVVEDKRVVLEDGLSSEPRELPANVLFWGNQDEVNTGGRGVESTSLPSSSLGSSSSSSCGKMEGELKIEIPRPMMDAFVWPAGTGTPTSARLSSLRRFLSREKKVVMVGSSCSSPCGHDIEQGLTPTQVPTSTEL